MINFKPFSPKALNFIRGSNARLNIADGSIRASKTVNCTVRWLKFLVEGPPGDLVMVGKTTGTLQRNVLNDIFSILGPKNYHWTNRQRGEITMLGRQVYCVGADNISAEARIRGATFAGAYCDEASLYPKEFFDQLMGRLSIEGAQCFCNCNPDSPFHWFYTDYIKNDAITDKKRWHFTMDDNLSLNSEYIESLKQMYTGLFYRRFILGEWCVAEGTIYDMFDPVLHVRVRNDAYLKSIIACDYGTSSVTSWSKINYYIDGSYHKPKEYYYDSIKERKQKTDSQFADEFEEFVNRDKSITIYCDPSAASWKAELRFRGYIVLDADNSVLDGIRKVSTLLAAGKFTIDPSCENSIKEYPAYAWDSIAQKLGEDKPIKKHDHACDSDRYAIYTHSLYGMSGVYRRRGT